MIIVYQRARRRGRSRALPGVSYGHDGADGAAPSLAFPTGMTDTQKPPNNQ
ncbi:MAG: hypothetical protein J6866_03370 [Victivallales bacterium]|nr:hypothetical protein [Victivallales bacterium]